jgi:hypothetical protein
MPHDNRDEWPNLSELQQPPRVFQRDPVDHARMVTAILVIVALWLLCVLLQTCAQDTAPADLQAYRDHVAEDR